MCVCILNLNIVIYVYVYIRKNTNNLVYLVYVNICKIIIYDAQVSTTLCICSKQL